MVQNYVPPPNNSGEITVQEIKHQQFEQELTRSNWRSLLDRYQLPPELEVESLYLHPLALMEKWGLDLETTARETGVDVGTLTRYRYPDYASTKRRPYRNKSVLRVAAVLDQLWSVTGCPYGGNYI